MVDTIVSFVAQRILSTLEEQIRDEVNLVGGVEEEARNLSEELKTIRNVLDDAERRRFKEKGVNDWLKKLENTANEMDDVLDEWSYAILQHEIETVQPDHGGVVAPRKKKVCSFIPSPCSCFEKVAVRRDIAKKIHKLKAQLNKILAEKDRYGFVIAQPITEPSPKYWRAESTSVVDSAQIYGREDDMIILVNKLTANDGRGEGVLDIPIVSIVGGGGLGKTTLAQLVHNDSRVKEYFDLRIWVCVSHPFDELEIGKRIIENAHGSFPPTNQLEMVLERLRKTVLGKKFLLVLDDVWSHRYSQWEPLKASLKCGGAGSKILVTTRNHGVAMMMGAIDSQICCLKQLSKADCWLVLRHMALLRRYEEEFERFQDVGMRIADKCNGLPLAAKVLGSLLRFKNSVDEWENILKSELWQLEEVEVEIFPHLLLSYNELSPAQKSCFSYCAIFPKDSELEVEKLIECWMALGYLGHGVGDMERKGRECFDNLAMRSLFQDFQKSAVNGQIKYCRMHDIVHDFAQFLRKNVRIQKSSCQDCSPLSISNVREYGSLFFTYNDDPPKHFDFLVSVRVLQVITQMHFPRAIENLIHLRWLCLNGVGLSTEEMKTICKLYNLQTLLLCKCDLSVIPSEIGNLIHLRHLNLHANNMSELPESLCGLRELRTLNLNYCEFLHILPEGIHRLVNLKHLHNKGTTQIPQLDQLTGLHTLDRLCGGSDLRLLKNLKQLTSLGLEIIIDDELENNVENAREAELSKKKHLEELEIKFHHNISMHDGQKLELMKLIDALEPHPDLQKLTIERYSGSKLPGWTISALNQLKFIKLDGCEYAVPLGKLPRLEEIVISNMSGLRVLGREFLDIDESSSAASSNVVAFPKLKKLTFEECPQWVEWEDITAEEEESATISLMPCLTELIIMCCSRLTAVPHRLLRKTAAAGWQMLDISYSTQLEKRYGDKDSSAWKSLSRNNPRLQLETRY